MPHIRKDIWRLGPGWSDTLLWYARGVHALQARASDDPTGWRFQAAMHGFDEGLWRTLGYLKPGDSLPSGADRSRFWQQCQHQSWYFLPWHRGYLAAFEAILRAAIAAQGGPADWALPYWNYSDTTVPQARELHRAFTDPSLPDGSPNPLLVEERYGDGSGHVVITPRDVELAALMEPRFAGAETGGSPGFGGPGTRFSHSGSTNGRVERRPHNNIHTLVGGAIPGRENDPTGWGLMTNPDTAALDPIFWVHHANIDRLWEVWLRRDARHRNPTDAGWLTGPADRAFTLVGPDGQGSTFAARDVVDTHAPRLDYDYEDVSDPLGGTNRLVARLERLGMAPPERVPQAASEIGATPQPTAAAELVGASEAPVALTGGPVETEVRLDRDATARMARSFQPGAAFAAGAPQEPDRVFLNLEGIRGTNDAAIFDVYVDLPQGANPADHPDRLAGVVSLFGVAKASRGDGPHGGNGINEVLDITRIVDALHLRNALGLDRLRVYFVPRGRLRPEHGISIQRVSVYREPQ